MGHKIAPESESGIYWKLTGVITGHSLEQSPE